MVLTSLQGIEMVLLLTTTFLRPVFDVSPLAFMAVKLKVCYGLEHLSAVLRGLGEEPIWQDLPNTQRSHSCKRALDSKKDQVCFNLKLALQIRQLYQLIAKYTKYISPNKMSERFSPFAISGLKIDCTWNRHPLHFILRLEGESTLVARDFLALLLRDWPSGFA